MKHATTQRIWIKAYAGLPEWVANNITYPTKPEQFASYVPDLVAAGASFLGGCCGTKPEFIRAIRERVEVLRRF